uniref:Uncharacterized protein n=1 Tax=Avena sativa TaxID=4498 RepID=A0ACD5VES8_AVESA
MDTGRDQSAKKPRVDARPSSVQVKQEIVVHQGAGAIVAVERVLPMTELGLKMDVAVLHCPICLHPLRPPVFQCKGGHLACPGCRSGGCVKCGNGAAFDIANTAMDDVVLAARMECLHAGCGSCVSYFEASDHQDACPHAPCSCTEPGCAFAAPPPELVAHLVAAHAMPVHRIPYGKVEPIQVSVPEPARVLLVGGAGEEADAFLLTLAAFGPATVVTAVCIRAAACPWPRYTVRMWVNGPPPEEANRRTDTMQTDLEARSSTTPGDVVWEDLRSYLVVPPQYLVGAGPCKLLSINVRIGKATS